jgi:hypothetical protein
MKLNVKKEVPPGSYRATFEGVEETTHEKYGEGLLWTWEITKGPYRGQKVMRTTKPEATAKNSTGKFLQMLTGLSLEKSANVDVDTFEGVDCHVIVNYGESGTSRVESFAVERDGGADASDRDESAVNQLLSDAAQDAQESDTNIPF